MFIITFAFLGLTCVLLVLCTTRSARLKRLARTWGLRYERQADSFFTVDTTRKMHFFNRGLHQFFHVLTWREGGLFIRIGEDRTYASPLDKNPHSIFTLAGAELTNGTFSPFVITPRTDSKEPTHPALPAQLATHFVLNAPADFKLPASVIGLLKAGHSCYLEAGPHALVYHEFEPLSIADIQPLHLRIKQLVQALVQKPTPTAKAPASAPITQAELMAQTLLRLQTPATAPAKSSARWYYAVVFLLVLIVVLVGASYLLRTFVPH